MNESRFSIVPKSKPGNQDKIAKFKQVSLQGQKSQQSDKNNSKQTETTSAKSSKFSNKPKRAGVERDNKSKSEHKPSSSNKSSRLDKNTRSNSNKSNSTTNSSKFSKDSNKKFKSSSNKSSSNKSITSKPKTAQDSSEAKSFSNATKHRKGASKSAIEHNNKSSHHKASNQCNQNHQSNQDKPLSKSKAKRQANLLRQQRCNDLVNSLSSYGIKQYDSSYFHNPRFQAAVLVKEVLEDKKSLTIDLEGIVDKQDIGFASELAFGVIRYLPQLNFITNKLLLKPFKSNCYFAYYILLLSLYQLLYMTRAEHAAVYENVELVKKIYGQGVSKVVNACLRNFLRNEEELVEQSKLTNLLPKWLNRSLQERVPEAKFVDMCVAMNHKPPFWIRVNSSKIDVEAYLELLTEHNHEFKQHPSLKTAVLIIKPVAVTNLPGFNEGYFSVQDLHAQFASIILTQPSQSIKTIIDNSFIADYTDYELLSDIDTNKEINVLTAHYQLASKLYEQNITELAKIKSLPKSKLEVDYVHESIDLSSPFILDSCCSPGGKTTHLLDLLPKSKMIASDIDSNRLLRVHENLDRLQQDAFVVQGDATKPNDWLPSACNELGNKDQELDLILLDVPCSGTGVIRRHPDIKWLRKKTDIEKLHQTQLEILKQSWNYLKQGGKLLYTSCSILGEENETVIQEFLANTTDAKLIDLTNFAQKNILPYSDYIELNGAGLQLINSINSGDGFYYCLLTRVE